ncbi:type II toxin-antitoxin system RelE/ParE family toxin [Streptomyces niveiscabiei]|uniref:type II toxin-antitoxin system RelE/ParE family toxin n=1 Tax=Streptomyces niveiscabiei TaxID=164115 RepID=UPI0029BF1867|nr:type II toxin-antitoxin system RelE/ParE family toxin [Streptomyces niveiscabiei]MDX3383780.1 type II toxin-antitoxin system RelE/ParE family toxin [Streptomyces niveiscabiei]
MFVPATGSAAPSPCTYQVEKWLDTLTPHDHGRVMFYADLLVDFDGILDEPYSRHLGGKVRELRFRLGQQHYRITYWLAPNHRIVFLTVFPKTQRQETAEVQRALLAQKTCEAEHPPAHTVYDRFPEDTP